MSSTLIGLFVLCRYAGRVGQHSIHHVRRRRADNVRDVVLDEAYGHILWLASTRNPCLQQAAIATAALRCGHADQYSIRQYHGRRASGRELQREHRVLVDNQHARAAIHHYQLQQVQHRAAVRLGDGGGEATSPAAVHMPMIG